MNNPLQMVLPMAGFIGGLFLWSRVAHLAIAVSGLTPNPSNPGRDPEAMERACRRLVLRIAAGWLCVTGAVLAYMLYYDKTGFALLIGGVSAVPLLTVTNFLVILRRLKRRAAEHGSQSPN